MDTIENIKNADKLVDFSGDSYSVLNTASNLVGVIRTGADAANTVLLDKSKNDGNSGSTGLKGISKNPEDYINLTAGISKSKSEMKTYDESAVKNSIEGKYINISSKEGSVVLEGTDIKAKNLSLEAKENIEIKAADEKHKSSNKSSSSGLSASISASETPITFTASASGAKGRGSGTSYVNSTIDVEEKLRAESENLKVSGANIEADKIDIKAKDIVIESKQDVSERKDSSFGASVSVGVTATGAVIPKDVSINGSRGKGKSEWVNNQTTVTARNGGSIEAENKLANTGAVLGSLNKDEKLKISAKEIEVKDLEDKDKYENKGGGISLGFDGMKPKVPNVSVIHDKVDKEQINRATAINTEITLNGEKVEAEELGFNTDLEKAQEKTKDEEKHLNVKLHTDLLNKDEKSKLVLAGRKVNALVEALTEDKGTDKLNVYKAALRAIHIDELRKEREKEFAFIDDKDTEPFDRLLALRELQKELYKKEGYTGKLPELNLTDEPNSFAVDGKNGETKKIFISLNDLNNGNASALLYAHENAHLVDYDKGEEIAKYAETKIGENNPKNKFTEKEKAEYKKKLRETIKIDKSLEQQFVEARSIDKNDRENFDFPRVARGAAITTISGIRFIGGAGEVVVGGPLATTGVASVAGGALVMHGSSEVVLGLNDGAIGLQEIWYGIIDKDEKESTNFLANKIGKDKYELWNFSSGSLSPIMRAYVNYYRPLSNIGSKNLKEINMTAENNFSSKNKDINNFKTSTSKTDQRYTPKESEIETYNRVKEMYKEDPKVVITPQASYKDKASETYGVKGTVRPEVSVSKNGDVFETYEVKNYDQKNYSSMTSSIGKQAIQRAENLPDSAVQKIVIDIRGQSITPEMKEKVINDIMRKSNNIIEKNNITFME